MFRGNCDSIKHAHQIITAFLKNSETELTNLLPSGSKSRTSTVVANHDNVDELLKTQRANTGPRPQNIGNFHFETFFVIRKTLVNFLSS